jgi:hypothetical protein
LAADYGRPKHRVLNEPATRAGSALPEPPVLGEA